MVITYEDVLKAFHNIRKNYFDRRIFDEDAQNAELSLYTFHLKIKPNVFWTLSKRGGYFFTKGKFIPKTTIELITREVLDKDHPKGDIDYNTTTVLGEFYGIGANFTNPEGCPDLYTEDLELAKETTFSRKFAMQVKKEYMAKKGL